MTDIVYDIITENLYFDIKYVGGLYDYQFHCCGQWSET